MINRYLKDLGITEKDWPFDKNLKDNRYIPDDTFLSQSDTWSMTGTLAMIIYTYLMKFKETNKMSYPASLKSLDEWDKILEEELKKVKTISELRILNEQNFFDFQNKVREAVGTKPVDFFEFDADPRIRAMKAKARSRDKLLF